MDFQTVDEVKNKVEMTKSLKWLKRIPRPANFLFKHSCEALAKQPLLLLASPGGKVNRALAEQLKEGSRPVWGQVRRRGEDLTFITRGRANKNLMIRKIAQLGTAHGVPIKKRNIRVITQKEGKALMAVERSVRRVRAARKPVGFVFKAKVATFDGPALLLMRGGAGRHISALGSGLVKGSVVVEKGKTVFTVTEGSVSPNQMVSLLKQLGKEYRSLIRNPEVVIGEGGTQIEGDMVGTEEAPTTGRRRGGSGSAPSTATESSSAPTSTAPTPEAKAPSSQKESLEETRRKIAAAQAAAAEARRKAEENARREAEERAAREAAEKERQERERVERERRERERADAEMARKKASLPTLQRRQAQALKESEAAGEELAKAEAAQAREEKLFSKKSLRRFEDIDALVDALIALNDTITAETGKPDKELRDLMRDLQREDDIDDAVDEVLEWFEERKEDLEDELKELREEAETLKQKADDLSSEIAEIEAS